MNDDAADTKLFLRELLADPRRISALAPSSAGLARLITRDIAPSTAPVIELGPGTGVFTRAMLDRGLPEQRLALVEAGDVFADLLAERFPRAVLIRGDAGRLPEHAPFGRERAGAIVSGLPLLSLPRAVQRGVLEGVRRHVRPGGALYQFTYGWRCPAPSALLSELGLTARRIGFEAFNLPPASVYRIAPVGG